MKNEAARVADIGEVREQPHILDEPDAGLVTALDPEGEDRACPLRQVFSCEIVIGATLEPGIGHPGDARMLREELRDFERILNMPVHPQRQRLDAGQGQKRVHRRQGRAEISEAHRARLCRKGEIAEILVEFEAVIGRLRIGQGAEAVAFRPIEAPRFDEHTAQGMPVAGQKLRRRMADKVGAPVEGPAQIRGRERVVDDQRNARLVRDAGHPFEIDDDAAGIGQVFEKNRLGARGERPAEVLRLPRIDEMAGPAELFERQPELRQRSAVKAL